MKQKKKWISVLIVLIFTYFTFLYTWGKDKYKFITIFGIHILIVAIGLPTFLLAIPFLWAIFLVAFGRDVLWYQNYYQTTGGEK